MTPDETLRQACEELADWFYRFHPNDTDSVNRLLAFAKAQRATEAREIKEAYQRWRESMVPKAGRWQPPEPFSEWIANRTAQWEGA